MELFHNTVTILLLLGVMMHLISHQPKYALFVIKQTLKELIVFVFLFLNNKVVIQYGRKSSTTGGWTNVTIKLPIAYTSTNYCITFGYRNFNQNAGNYTQNREINAYSLTTTQFNCSNFGGYYYFWLSIGY